MLNTASYSDHRLQTRKLAQELIEKRRHLWRLYEQLVKLQPYAADQPLEPLARRFCQELVDYLSLDHFGIFHHLFDGNERRLSLLELAGEVYPKLAETTAAALRFNDRCLALPSAGLRAALPAALAKLGEDLALRVHLEDRLLEAMAA